VTKEQMLKTGYLLRKKGVGRQFYGRFCIEPEEDGKLEDDKKLGEKDD